MCPPLRTGDHLAVRSDGQDGRREARALASRRQTCYGAAALGAGRDKHAAGRACDRGSVIKTAPRPSDQRDDGSSGAPLLPLPSRVADAVASSGPLPTVLTDAYDVGAVAFARGLRR